MITSSHNPRLKELRKLHERRHRELSGLFLAEGEDMLGEALTRGAYPEEVYYDPDGLAADHPVLAALPAAVKAVPVQGDALASAGTLGSGARMIGVWKQRWTGINAGRRLAATTGSSEGSGGASDRDVAIYLHEVADPGNVGAIVRSTLALVPGIVILSPGTADPFGPKAVRASMGAIFGQPVARASFEQVLARLGGHFEAIALLPRAGRPLREIDLGGPVLFCLGSERLGLPESVVADCDEVAHVPLNPGGAESLNVAMTATLCLYESALHRLSS
jgi:TrmH family RNA methyltransferase